MASKFKGVMQSPVTPLKEDFSLDLQTFEKVIDFHIRTGATAISWPHHKGESLNLTIDERKYFAEAAVRVANARVPVTIHVSALAVEDTHDLARHAESIGADGILAITPYIWSLTPDSIYNYFVRLCESIELPVLSYNSPSYLAGVKMSSELIERLVCKLPNFIGVKEASFNSETFIEISRVALKLNPDFAMLTGVEFLLPSVPLGGVGCYSAAGSICPNLCLQLYKSCISGEWEEARILQNKVTRIWHLFKDQYPSSLKGGMVIMGRPVGPTRSPLPTADAERCKYIQSELEDLGILESEPYGW
ncbi:dihydrodipicolinate synthase family protein [Hyphomicrobiales bacterium]|jgi:dihydrodipicolinate synthase/N-acetylneuraminate lyase|nr:dihydrodipicolinate synthase family protein [Rhodobiaceae bacterium]MBT5640082.1 dihydrodipicolinate synthase family protein [Rhodobiaceae bacterium]MBT6222714.1 dihydrodipicolinate synthase family protein [Rhodobiaceae bacterium]MDB4127835.1 dihydrodipicolinate synthase family protein [Hyphomicrobiales bacterium]